MKPSNRPEYIILHTVAKKGLTELDEITQWHIKRGFRTVGYHYYIRKDGQLDFGRDEDEAGAHCIEQGMNTKSIGICMEGHGNYEPWTTDQIITLRVICLHIMQLYKIPVSNILGHRETGAQKDCPGKLIDMATVRREIETYQRLTNESNQKNIEPLTL